MLISFFQCAACFGRQAGTLVVLLLAGHAMAFEVGLREISVPGSTDDAPSTQVALYYPTETPAHAIPMGPFTVHVALQATPEARVKGPIVVSHGTGGSELGHTSLAEALAREGYLVAALRHPRDNWADHSLLQDDAGRYFDERPRQVSHVIDALLADPEWKDRIAVDAHGPRIGAIGHSAGGYTVLALAGGLPDLRRVAEHCASHRAEDPLFCAMGRSGQSATQAAASPSSAAAPLRDPRVRAVVALSPVGVIFTARSLAGIAIPTAVYVAELDRFLVPRFHGDWVRQNMTAAEFHTVSNAWHFAFMDTPTMKIPTEDGDLGADPPGFDRAAFLQQLGRALPLFFDRALR